MTTLIIGASGATGKLLVDRLVTEENRVKIIIRPASNFPDNWNKNDKLTIIKKNLTELTIDEISDYVTDCQAVAFCLGHNMTFKGIFGKPRKLVANSVQLFCDAIHNINPERPIKFVLMNTSGYRNPDVNEPVSIGQRFIIGLLRIFLPPHLDNEMAADFLRVNIGQMNPYIEWVVVRPDTLINEQKISEYTLHKSPTRSAFFNPGKTSRINVSHFMANLILDHEVWKRWKGQMPVIYNEND